MSSEIEEIGVDVESSRVLEPEGLREEGDEYFAVVVREYQQDFDTGN